LLFPLRVRVALERVEKHPGLSALTGTVAMVAILPIAIMLLLSIIGIPLIVIEFAALLAGIWIGHAAVALLVGRRLYELVKPHATPSPLGALILGLLVVSAAQTLPVVGWAVTALVWIVGLGATVLAFMRESAFRTTSGTPATGTIPANPA
jgi:peptidoglycan/LPS O-acetylase OafA/YrhL